MSSAATMQQAKTEVPQTAQRSSQRNSEHAFADLRPQATAQRQLQDTASHSSQSRQLKVLQQMAQNSTRSTQLKSMSEMTNAPALQRVKEEDALQAKMPISPVQREVAASAKKVPASNNTGLPDNLKSGIESLSGMRMDHVKVHYNSARPAQLNAHAYAQGRDIHLAAGQEQHLPHEAWHVVQQAQGRVAPTTQMNSGVAINDDQHLEAEADRMGSQALSAGTSVTQQKTRDMTSPAHPSPVVQRVEIGERPIKDGYASLTSHSSWPQKAEAYEKRLGVYAYSHGSATAAIDDGLNKMKAMINQYYNADIGDAIRKQALYREVFTKDDAYSAGQIGPGADLATIETMLTGGNLRERTTAFYNAAYFNSPPGVPLRGFKAILHQILFQDQIVLAQTLGLNENELHQKALFLKENLLRRGIKSVTSLTNKGYNFEDDPFALGNLTLAEELRGTAEMGLSQNERVNRPGTEYDAEKRSAADYQALGLGLSDREKKYTASKMTMPHTDPTYDTAKLPWLEGHTYYRMEKGTVSWISKIRDSLHMPIVAGVSGTTTRMLSAYKWLNGANPENFRLALMGWMLPAWDHSLYEIMRGSHLAGIKPAGDSDLTDVIDMYMHIAPLTTDTLRNNVAINKQFPHEEIYMERTKDETSPDADAFISAHAANKTAATANYNLHGAVNNSMSAAHSTAIYNYTSGIHSLMNASLSMPAIAAKKVIQSKLTASAHYACRHAWLAANHATLNAEQLAEFGSPPVEAIDTLKKSGNLNSWQTICAILPNFAKVDEFIQLTVDPWIASVIDSTYEEMKVHANMTVEGMNALPPVTGIDVWRGDWTSMVGSAYEKGKTITYSTLTSYSKNSMTALSFATDGKASYKVLVKLQLSGKGGRDIVPYSKYAEDEVLLMPGSTVRITDVTWVKDKGKDLKLCTATEV